MRSLRSIKFPVYPIPNRGTVFRDGTTLKYRPASGNNEYIIDDIAVPGKFSRRRILINESLLPNEKLLALNRAVLTLGGLIVFASIYSQFIDTNGKLFKYSRETLVQVTKRRIISTVPYKSGSMVYIEGVHCPILFYRQVDSSEIYAVLILINKGYILLGVTANEYFRKRRIKI